MNAPSRNPSGTPTGGQFAPGQHAETEVAVADSVHAPPDTAAVDAFGAEGDVISELRQQVEQRQGALSTQAAALVTQQVRTRYPSAVQVDFIRFDRDEDNPEETVVFSSVRDDDGEILCAADDGGDLDFQGSSGRTSFDEVAATVRPDASGTFNDSPDGFSLAVTPTYDGETTR